MVIFIPQGVCITDKTDREDKKMTREICAGLISEAVNAAVRAGAEIMKIYKQTADYDVSLKSDRSPVTAADRAAHNCIRESLGATCIPVLSEEGREMLYDERRNWDMFWLVDPLDGTVEFIKGNNEFTVNIALIQDNLCVCSVIYMPCTGKLYIAEKGHGAYFIADIEPSSDADYSYDELVSRWSSLPLGDDGRTHTRIAVSRSHSTPETAEMIDDLCRRFPDAEIVEQGSSYKFCMLAEGSADYYVRTSTTYEWDTAAGELILCEAGGSMSSLDDGAALRYNKEDMRNPWFECRSPKCKI